MKTKKINELMMMETVSDAANVLVEENGEAKRIPAGKMVAGSLPEHLQFGETVVGGDTLTWDGNTDGLLTVEDPSGYMSLAKLSDALPTLEDLANGITCALTIITPEGAVVQEEQVPANDIVTPCEGILSAGVVVIVHETALNIEMGELGGVVFTETGIYSVYQEVMYMSSLTIPGYAGFVTKTVKPLDEKYLPDNVKTPAVTADDNGKFLRVVDGAWAAATVPSAEEASF